MRYGAGKAQQCRYAKNRLFKHSTGSSVDEDRYVNKNLEKGRNKDGGNKYLRKKGNVRTCADMSIGGWGILGLFNLLITKAGYEKRVSIRVAPDDSKESKLIYTYNNRLNIYSKYRVNTYFVSKSA
jgi:hypothetical protein